MSDGNVTLNVSVDPLVAYPIGSIYMSVNSTNPSQLFGGTWVALNEGRVLIGAGTAYPAGTTGGEATHTLTTKEMPSHSHSGSAGSASLTGYFNVPNGAYETGRTYFNTSGIASRSEDATYVGNGQGGGKGGRIKIDASHSHSVSIGSAGSGSAHNNMQPYLSVYMWKRTA